MFARPTLRMIARSAAPSHLRRTVARTYVNDASQSTAPAKAVAAVLVGAAGYSLYVSGDAAQKTEELSYEKFQQGLEHVMNIVSYGDAESFAKERL